MKELTLNSNNSKTLQKILQGSQRILVLGSAGVGKTHLSAQFSYYLNLPIIHLDMEFWQPGWIATSQNNWRIKLKSLLSRPKWVMDGTYESSLDIRIPAADLIVLIERPRLMCLAGVLLRYWRHGSRARMDAPRGQTLEPAFMSYIWNYQDRTAPLIRHLIKTCGSSLPVILLRSRSEVQEFVSLLDNNTSPFQPGQISHKNIR